MKKIEDLQNLRNAKEYSKEFGEEDMKNVLKLLSDVARKYDKNMPGQPMMDGFDNVLYMEPHIFKDQLQRSFKIKITPREMGALLSYFNADEKGNVFMASFLGKFFKIGLDERADRRAKTIRQKFLLLENSKKGEENRQQQAADKQILHLPGFTDTDLKSAFAKLSEGALRYDRSGALSIGLGGFVAVSMPPHIFKDQLKR